uniref:DUSP domain-containing protein n=1 Tax=Euplotes harpa TaxID=151035 RepID=A0A7S3J7B6_9SPIT|mmetsp:Transcript_19258/g.22325  ORF Transcript_19258/g.22325 Transcript_19258/m.22325 type:complete len:186 (+) Transcript_19258:1144-1701(+)
MIDENWMKSWESFTKNKLSEFTLQMTDENEEALILPPGPISNHQLLNPDGSVKQDLKIGEYRLITPEMWNSLYFTYSGGPEIHRERAYIFSKAVHDNLEKQAFQERIDAIKERNREKAGLDCGIKSSSPYKVLEYLEKDGYDPINDMEEELVEMYRNYNPKKDDNLLNDRNRRRAMFDDWDYQLK